MPTASNDGVEIHYEVDGPDDGPAVVLIEGLGYGRWMWRWQRQALREDYRLILPDNRGTGDSDAPGGPYTIATMADDVEAVLEDAGVESAHLVGASMGGMIAQEYALRHDRAETLSLLCSSPGGEVAVPTPPEVQERIFDVPDDLGPREEIKYKMRPAMTDDFFDSNPDLIERIVDWRLESDAGDAARQAQAAGVLEFDASDRLEGIDVPTLVLHGTADRVLPVENGELLADLIPGAELERFEGGPHLFFIEQAEAVNERLEAFLAERTETDAPDGTTEESHV